MKKLLLLSFLSIILFSNVKGQNKDYIFGIKAGANVAKLTDFDGDSKTGFIGGISFEYPMSQYFSLQSETLLSFQGAKATDSTPEIKLTYLNWPILMKYYLGNSFHVVLGPQVDFLLGGKGGKINKSDYKFFELGLATGIGIQLSEGLTLEARYAHGLTKIDKVNDFKNSGFQFTLNISM